MGRVIDLTGQRFERLEVLHRDVDSKYIKPYWICRCDCGKTKSISGCSLRLGLSKSCGCKTAESASVRNRTHGKKGSRVYSTWQNMKERCLSENNPRYPMYGGRGISICDRWFKFENFYEDMGDPEENLSLDRIDVNGNYCKENCRWATQEQQDNNKRDSCKLTFNGITKTSAEWSRELGIPKSTIQYRLKRNLPVEEVLHKRISNGK